MKAEIINAVVDKLVGKIVPVADSSIDKERIANMQVFIDVLDSMYEAVESIATNFKDSQFHSAKAIGLLAQKWIDSKSPSAK